MPQDQSVRDLVARMKLIPIQELIAGKRLLFCEDSIVRGTQLKDTIQRLHDAGAVEVHMRPACPPLVFGCKYLNFSRSKNELALAARKAAKAIGGDDCDISDFVEGGRRHEEVVEKIRKTLKLTSLRYPPFEDMVKAIGLPREKLCPGCWEK
jgi:amidophosphoribosyltransferase